MDISYDTLAGERVKFGRYHYISYAIISLTNLNNGSLIACLSFLLPILTKEWELSVNQQEVLGVTLFLGIFIGSLAQGYFSDKYGRRLTLILAVLLQVLIGALTMMTSNFYSLSILRVLSGATIGITMPLAVIFVSEISPARIRGMAAVIVSFGMTLGYLFGCLIALFTLDTLSSGNWRLMLLLGVIPGVLGMLGLCFFVYESARYEIAHGNIEKAVEILNKIGGKNERGFNKIVFDDVKDGLRLWTINTFDQNQKANVSIIFSRKHIRITLCLMALKFCYDFVGYGFVFISPYLLDIRKQQIHYHGLRDISFTYLSEIPAIFLSLLIIENKYLGRKKSLVLISTLVLLFTLLPLLGFEIGIVLALSLSKGFLKMGQPIYWATVSESYPTIYRSLAVGIVSGVSRLGCVIVPVVSLWLYQIDENGPMYCYAGILLLAVISCIFIPYDLRGKELDVQHRVDVENVIEAGVQYKSETSMASLQHKLLQNELVRQNTH